MVSGKPQRKTRQRELVLEALRKTRLHPTAMEVYDTVRQVLPTISLGTVYRNLDRLVQMGEAQRLEWAGMESRYDANAKPHCHVRCIQCGCLADLPCPEAGEQPPPPAETGGYRILGCRLEFLGLCPNCQAQEKKEQKNAESQD